MNTIEIAAARLRAGGPHAHHLGEHSQRGFDADLARRRVIAGDHRIPSVEKIHRSRGLCTRRSRSTSDPPDHYTVAEVIGYVLRLRRTAIRYAVLPRGPRTNNPQQN